jgi:hypothetical protein
VRIQKDCRAMQKSCRAIHKDCRTMQDLNALMGRSCDWVRVYLHNPNSGVKEEDRHLCDGIGTKNYRTKKIWSQLPR